jgi:colicin import membrane protein
MALALLVLLCGGAVAGCGSTSKAHTTAEPSAAGIEHSEEAADRKQETEELTKDGELLAKIEGQKREEAAEQNAKHKEAIAAAKAKKREQAAAKAVKRKEQAAEAKIKKREAELKAQAVKLQEATAEAEKKQQAAKKKSELEQNTGDRGAGEGSAGETPAQSG